jgi:ABC-2 type transport system ATP-binding protein
MIFAEDLTKKFDDFLAVDGVNLDVKAGQVLVILGPNGAGKTTTVRMLTSILVPTRGRAVVAGYDVIRQADQVRASVGVLTEHHGLYSRMNSVDYLLFFAQLYGIDRTLAQKRILTLLETFGLGTARSKRLGEYSKGMRQKLALVRALLHEPPVLLLDEPTSAMDPESARTVRDAIRSLKDDRRTIILCTHNLVEAEDLADQIAIIRQGRIILNDTPENLKWQLLGPVEYEAHLATSLNGWIPDLPAGTQLVEKTERSLRFRTLQPENANPVLLRQLMNHQVDVISFQEVHRSLEDAYLRAINQGEPTL